MFKSKSYNVKKVSEKNEKEASTSTGTLKKSSSSSGSMTLAKKEKIKSTNNKESPEYSKKIPKKTVTTWKKNETFTAKNEPKKTLILSPHKKLERK